VINTSEDKIKKSKHTMKEEMQAVIDEIDKTDIENKSVESIPESELEGASEDNDPSEFTEGTDRPSDIKTETNPELATKKDRRFSKEIPIDEKELRENKQRNA
jgi:hypothetical protein